MAITRRGFLFGSGAALGFATAAGKLGSLGGLLEGTASASLSYTGYRAIVCVFLAGGNDGNNMIIPMTAAGYAKYAAVRPVSSSTTSISQADLANTKLNPVGGAAGSYAFNPAMPKLARLFNGLDAAGGALPGGPKLAIVPNVGPLVAPMTKAQYTDGSVVKPENLFSHSNQVAAWESSIANPLSVSGLPTGWGGRMADKLTVNNPGDYPDITSLTGLRLFATGKDRKPIVVPSNGVRGRNSPGPSAVNSVRDAPATQLQPYGRTKAGAMIHERGHENRMGRRTSGSPRLVCLVADDDRGLTKP